jgi:hypothetical protein
MVWAARGEVEEGREVTDGLVEGLYTVKTRGVEKERGKHSVSISGDTQGSTGPQ